MWARRSGEIGLGLSVLFGVLAGCGGGEEVSVNVTEVSTGAPMENLLKGMSVAVDANANRCFVSGIMTDTVGVVDLESATLRDVFSIEENVPATKKMVYDPGNGKLWLASGKGDGLWIVDPDSRETLLTMDISGDTAANANSYPTKSIALDPKRERLFMARSDGVVGGRVVIYDSSLKKVGEILEGKNAHALEWDSERDALVVLTAPKNSQGEILVVWKGDDSQLESFPAPYEGGAPPSQIAIAPGGSFYVGGQNLWKVDVAGAVEWKSVLPSTASAMEVSDEEVGVLYQHGLLSEEDRFVSRFETYASDTGEFLVRRKVRFEASRMAVNRTTGEFVVGNGGDSSITILPIGEEEGKTVRVGSSAEDVLLTSDGERLLILNRLGGSEMIERNLKTGESRVVGAGFWPMRMTVREPEDRLYVMNHFETKLSILRLSDLETVGEFSLGLPSCIGDTIAEMAFDSEGMILACLVCEQGKVVVVNTVDSKIINTITLAEPNDSYGPGRLQGAVDGEKKRVYVYVDKEQVLYRLDGASDYEVGKSALVIPGEVARNGYALSGVFYSNLSGLLFVNDRVVHPTTLKTLTSLEGVSRVVAEEPGVIYAQRRGADRKEYLVRIDPDTLEVISSEFLLSTEKMASYISFDFKNRKYAVSNPAEAEVTVYDLE